MYKLYERQPKPAEEHQMMIPNSRHITCKVSVETWKQAQAWEKDFWLRQQNNLARYGKNWAWKVLHALALVDKYRGDDDNQWWASCFDNYQFLPKQVDNMIEVGCGPYTNVRFVERACKPAHLVLSDPLIRTYVKFNMTFVKEAYKNCFCYFDDHPIESLPFKDNYFDVVIMINVLDHVQDALVCMDTVTRIVKPGGYFIIGQDLTNAADAERHPVGMRIGHPIVLDASWFEPYLRYFDPVVNRILPRGQGRTPEWHYATLLFAGTKSELVL